MADPSDRPLDEVVQELGRKLVREGFHPSVIAQKVRMSPQGLGMALAGFKVHAETREKCSRLEEIAQELRATRKK